ncbi:major facilitator superfamily domain-containing protein [Dipodascopsis uninucleata]
MRDPNRKQEMAADQIIDTKDGMEQINNVTVSASIEQQEIGGNGETKEKDLGSVEARASEGEPYSIFPERNKRLTVVLAVLAGFFSPLTINIYIPALNSIANDLHVSNSRVNLTITVYMLLQAVAPAFLGDFSDQSGRRLAVIVCFVVYIGCNVGLAIQNRYSVLMILRCFQSAGISGTVTLANAIVADIITSSERGSYMGYASVITVLAPALSPVIGGLLSEFCGWHWIFWFLVIAGSVYGLVLVVLFPETCRSIVRNGSYFPPVHLMTIGEYIEYRRGKSSRLPPLKRETSFSLPNPIKAVFMAFDLEPCLILLVVGIQYACFYAVLSASPSQYRTIYGYSDMVIGLLQLPFAGGGIFSSILMGKLLNSRYHLYAKRYSIQVDRNKQADLSDFPLEIARLEFLMPLMTLALTCIIGLGWMLAAQVSIAGPIVLLFLIGFSLFASFNCANVLLVDIRPGRTAAITAATNLVRCLLGAGSSAIIIPMINSIRIGWSFTVVGIIGMSTIPLIWVLMKYGQEWRKKDKNAKIPTSK